MCTSNAHILNHLPQTETYLLPVFLPHPGPCVPALGTQVLGIVHRFWTFGAQKHAFLPTPPQPGPCNDFYG